jgi:hypothetical protein
MVLSKHAAYGCARQLRNGLEREIAAESLRLVRGRTLDARRRTAARLAQLALWLSEGRTEVPS